MKTILATALLMLFLTACASVTRTEGASGEKYDGLALAAMKSKPLAQLEPGRHVNLKLTELSPTVSLGRVVGKFEMLGLRGTKDQTFKIHVMALCDCLGFRKWSVSPVVYLLGPRGEVIAKEGVVDPKTRLLEGAFPADGDYQLLIIADTSALGSRLADVVAYNPNTGSAIVMAETAHATGTVGVRWNKPN
jgi:hypothetical protein